MPSALRFLALAAAGCAAAGCAPSIVQEKIAGLDVTVDGAHLELVNDGRVLLQTDAGTVGVRALKASFDMQFGMFDIEEQSGDFAFADHFAITAATPDRIAFDVVDADGATLAAGSVRGDEGGVLVSVEASAGDDVTLGSVCTFSHAIGLGAQTHDVDHHGQRVPLWVSEQGIGTTGDDNLPAVWQLVGRRHTSYAPIPAFVADDGAAYLVDTHAFSRVDLCATDPRAATFEAWEPKLLLRVWAGDHGLDPASAQKKMVDALGRPPLPPPWTFAPWNDAIFGSDNVRAVAAKLRAAGIPSSVLWTEDWRGGQDAGGGVYRLDEDWNPDPVLYPDFGQMVKDVNALGFQQLVYFNTFVVTGADIFDDVTGGHLAIQASDPAQAGPGGSFMFTGSDRDFSPTTLVDLTNPDARAFVKQHLEDALAQGVRGWMADFGEWLPADGITLADKSDPRLTHNQYPVLWQEVNREAQEEAGVLDDSVIFERSAHLGSQPLVQVIWAGDQRTDFEADDGLPTILPIGIGLSTTGFPFFAHDVAGYQSATNPPGDKELFLRWTELGAFTPVMRTHHGTNVSQNVNLFTDDDTLAHWKRYATLHMRLYPYLRALAHEACGKGGAQPWTPLPLAFPKDDVWTLEDEVMLGPALLVAPVVTQGAEHRAVRFPSARFAAFSPAFDGGAASVVDGPADVDVDAPLSEIPVYVRAGGIVPMTANVPDTLLRSVGGLQGIESTEGNRVVVVGLGADGSFTEESGAGYALAGTGTTKPASSEPDGAVVVHGNGVVAGDGFTFTLTGQPAGRTTRVIFE